jgi:hypothetical protein
MKRREFICAGIVLAAASLLTGASKTLHVEVWYGRRQRVGHLGSAQDDFNVLGHVYAANPIASVTCSVNGGVPKLLEFRILRRIVRYGDFNADIPVASLHFGDNDVMIQATDSTGRTTSTQVNVTRSMVGAYPLPAKISWGSVSNLQDVGQCVDGRWVSGPDGLRSSEAGYDRIFLIGDRTWKDYEATASITIHGFSKKNGAESGVGHCAGFCMRWAGHSTEDNAPGDQPKWGLYPRGGVTWLVWRTRDGLMSPFRNFLHGESEDDRDFAPFPVQLGRSFWMKGRCETLDGDGVTGYSFKVWNKSAQEPSEWDYRVTQKSNYALRSGGLALVAHEIDATFGDLVISDLTV